MPSIEAVYPRSATPDIRGLDEDEVVAYKRFVFSLADTVARAHREGGFLGLGGSEISEHEQEALDEVAAIFDEPQNA